MYVNQRNEVFEMWFDMTGNNYTDTTDGGLWTYLSDFFRWLF